ncbi:MAG: GNAT family N-acetyltransferase [Pseudomonadota bacterium]
MQIVPLGRNHDRTGFDCGVPELNHFLKSTARQHNDKGISKTFVLTGEQNPQFILGFFTLTICEVNIKEVPADYARKYPPPHGLPAVRLARLGVSVKEQGKRYGEVLLGEAVFRTGLIAQQTGLIGLFVDAKDEHAQRFYEKYGFIGTEGRSRLLFLPVETLRQP